MQKSKMFYCFLIISLLVVFMSNNLLIAEDFPTGLIPLTEEQEKWLKENVKVLKSMYINDIGYERIKKHLANQGYRMPDLKVVKRGYDIAEAYYQNEKRLLSTAKISVIPPYALPVFVDNQKTKYFPKIRRQTYGSCGQWAGVYYNLTNEYALNHDIDVKTLDLDVIFSPYFTYSVAVGKNAGSWYTAGWEVNKYMGAMTWNEYGKVSYSYLPTDPTKWRSALNKQCKEYFSLNKKDRTNIKTLLNNGHVISFATYINSWSMGGLKDNTSSTDDDYYVSNNGYEGVRSVNGTSGYHAMTVAGYNDAIWVDIDNDNVRESNEVGAYLIINSWGSSKDKTWMPYTLFENNSRAAGVLYYPTVKVNYKPEVIGKFTVNNRYRDSVRMKYGLSNDSQTTPSVTVTPNYIHGHYAFDGSSTTCDGTFFYDFTDIMKEDLTRWYIGISGSNTVYDSMTLYKVENGQDKFIANASGLPTTVSSGYHYAYVEWDSNNAQDNDMGTGGDAYNSYNANNNATQIPQGANGEGYIEYPSDQYDQYKVPVASGDTICITFTPPSGATALDFLIFNTNKSQLGYFSNVTGQISKTYTVTGSGYIYITVDGDSVNDKGKYTLSVIATQSGDMGTGGDAYNAYNAHDNATQIPQGANGKGYIEYSSDQYDQYKVPVTSGDTIHITFTPPSGATALDFLIFNTNKSSIGYFSNVTGQVSKTYTATGSGYIYITVDGDSVNDKGKYSLSVMLQ